MRVRNKTDHGVFANGYGVIPGGEEATVPQSDGVKELIKGGTLAEVRSSSSNDKEGDG